MVATKGTRSRRKTSVTNPKKTMTLDGTIVKQNYCRRCQETKAPTEFYDATDTQLDRNGKMSICKDCIDDLFNKIFSIEHDLNKTILILCRMLNLIYIENAVQSTVAHATKMFDKNGNLGPIFGFYKSKVTSFATLNQTGVLTFTEPSSSQSQTPMLDDDVDNADYYRQFWGDGLAFEDYAWLEKELAEWKNTHKVDTRSELSLLKMIVLKLFDIRKARAMDKDTSALEKSFQDLLKTSALSPSMSNQASNGKGQETFGVWIQDIEKIEPAEFWDEERRNKYIDLNHFGQYCKDYIVRPISNFFGISKDFNISEDDDLLVDDSAPLEEIPGDSNANLN